MMFCKCKYITYHIRHRHVLLLLLLCCCSSLLLLLKLFPLSPPPPPPRINSTTNSKNHKRNKYKEQTTRRGDNVVTYCPNELRNKQCAFVSETADTIFQVVNVANIPNIVTHIFNNNTKPIQNGSRLLCC